MKQSKNAVDFKVGQESFTSRTVMGVINGAIGGVYGMFAWAIITDSHKLNLIMANEGLYNFDATNYLIPTVVGCAALMGISRFFGRAKRTYVGLGILGATAGAAAFLTSGSLVTGALVGLFGAFVMPKAMHRFFQECGKALRPAWVEQIRAERAKKNTKEKKL